MCGISGFIQRGQKHERLCATATAMAAAMEHRGPDGSGVWADEAAGIALSHRRLSIQDLSPAGHQPMESACGRFVITFNGEVYNFRPLSAELQAAGHSFRGHSDTEVMLAAIREWGLDEALRRMQGMFAFGLWDRELRTLTLVRDRVGKKPLYYGWFGDAFLFGSELKALRQHPGFRPEIDRDALGTFIQYSWIPSPYSIFRQVKKLPPGSYVVVSPDGGWDATQPEIYWSAKEVAERGEREPFGGSLTEATDALEALLKDATAERMIADVSLGAMLSGGFDSTLIVAMMQSVNAAPVKTFSIGFHEAEYNEATHAKAISEYLGTDHTELYVSSQEAMQVIPDLPKLYDEPFADASQIPTFLVSRLAHNDVTVALTGDGGDELFAGYTRYPSALKNWKKLQKISPFARRFGYRAGQLLLDNGWGILESISTSDRGWPAKAGKALAKMQRKIERWQATDPMDMFACMTVHDATSSRFVPGARQLQTVLNHRSDWPQLREPLQTMMYLDLMGFMTDDILVKVDRASMGVSLEVRSPLLDHRIVEFAWSLPMSLRIGPGGGKQVVRELLSRYVPREMTDRPKAGFNVPVGEWLRGPLRDWAEELLAPARIEQQGLLDNHAVQRLWQQHQSGWRNHKNLVWSILMFQAWYEDAGL
ncbi:asparagine synthase (glutamine-hydrolyzing) [Pseudomonadota bacterium]